MKSPKSPKKQKPKEYAVCTCIDRINPITRKHSSFTKIIVGRFATYAEADEFASRLEQQAEQMVPNPLWVTPKTGGKS